MLTTSKKIVIITFILFSTGVLNFNLVIGTSNNGSSRLNMNSIEQNNSTNDTGLCAYIGPENVMYASIVTNNATPISGAKVTGYVDYACGNSTTRPLTTVFTPINGTVGLSCSFCNTFGPYNVTITTGYQNSSFYINTTMKYLGQTTWVVLDLTTHSYSRQEFDGSKCPTYYNVSFSKIKSDFYCVSQNTQNSQNLKPTTTNFYWLSILIVPLYAMERFRKKNRE